jgi:hypothetical protein
MPKIPTYDQLGQRVKDVSPQIGLRADPGMVNSQLAAADFYAKAQDVAYNFSMAEQAENTKAAKSEIKALYNDQSSELIRNSKKIDTAGAQSELDAFNKKFEKEYYNKGLNKSQVKEIKTEMNLYQSSKMQNHKTLSFDRGRDYNSTKHNEYINSLTNEIARLPVGHPARKPMEQELRETHATAILNGETANLDSKTFEDSWAKIQVNDYSILAETANTLEESKSLRESLENSSVSFKDKAIIKNTIKLSETRIETEYSDAIQKEALAKDSEYFLNDETFEKGIADIKKGSTFSVMNSRGVKVTINTKDLPASTLKNIISQMNTQRVQSESEELNNIQNNTIKSIQNYSLSSLQQDLKKIDNGTLYTEMKSFKARQVLKSVYSEMIKKRQTEDLVVAGKNRNTIAVALETSNGVITPEIKNKINETKNIYNLSDRPDLLENLDSELNVNVESFALFKNTQFSSITDVTKAEMEAKKSYESAPIDKKYYKQEVYKNLLKKNKAARLLFEKDPVGYLETQLSEVLSPSQRIAKQQTMGIMGNKLRIASDNEIKQFQIDFSSEKDFSKKADVGEAFFKKFGIEHENLVMKNLVQRGVITKVESLMLSDPKNVFMETIATANSEVEITANKAHNAFDAKTKTSIMDGVYKKLEPYSTSIVGSAYKGDLDEGLSTPAHKHLEDTAQIINNISMFYIRKGTSQSNAIKNAYDMVLGNSNEFFEINNKSIRVEKGSGYNTEGIKNVLSFIINNKENLSKSVISAEQQGIAATETSKEYVNELSSQGSWRTTVDNKSVYLVDSTGNMVRRKDFSGASDVGGSGVIDASSPFIVIKFDTLEQIASGAQEITEKYSYLSAVPLKKREIEEFYKSRAIF